MEVGHGEDIAAIMPVMTAAFDPAFGEAWSEAQCRGALALPGCHLLLARDKDAVIGFAILRTVLDEAELMLIAIDPAKQGQGAGRLLLDAVMDLCTCQGVSQVHVEMRSDNPAFTFYAAAGFTVTGQRRNYYRRQDGKSADALSLCRVLPI